MNEWINQNMQFYKTVKRKIPICSDSGDSPGGL